LCIYQTHSGDQILYITEIFPQLNTDVKVHSGSRFTAEERNGSRFTGEVGGSRLAFMVR
jgi:hypothetical protein